MTKQTPVLAIDPGLEKSGFVVWDGGSVLASGIEDNDWILRRIRNSNNPIVCEMIASYGMAVGKSVFETCVWIGRFQEACLVAGSPWNILYRLDVKLHVCKSPKAKDGNIRQALLDRIGPVGTLKNQGPLFGVKSHIWAALALAVTFFDKQNMQPAHTHEKTKTLSQSNQTKARA
jgi:hypothetical protein